MLTRSRSSDLSYLPRKKTSAPLFPLILSLCQISISFVLIVPHRFSAAAIWLFDVKREIFNAEGQRQQQQQPPILNLLYRKTR